MEMFYNRELTYRADVTDEMIKFLVEEIKEQHDVKITKEEVAELIGDGEIMNDYSDAVYAWISHLAEHDREEVSEHGDADGVEFTE